MALDWAKAFDSINSDALLQALKIFGIPEPFIQVIAAIYSDRKFQVRECGVFSNTHHQKSGICQGCPLSPYLFIIVMTVLMDRARKSLSPGARQALELHQLFDVLYADDTLIAGANPAFVEEFAVAVEAAGAEFDMPLHWGKTQALSVASDQDLHGPDGESTRDSGSLVYLGGLICADGRSDSEVSRRLGMATWEYGSLQKMWGMAASRARKKSKS